MLSNHPLVARLRDLEKFSWEWQTARDSLAEEDPDTYRRWLRDEWDTDQKLRELNGERRIPDDPAEFMTWWKSTYRSNDNDA